MGHMTKCSRQTNRRRGQDNRVQSNDGESESDNSLAVVSKTVMELSKLPRVNLNLSDANCSFMVEDAKESMPIMYELSMI